MIGISQIYVGVHFPLDVACGSIIGIAIGWLWAKVFMNYYGKYCNPMKPTSLHEIKDLLLNNYSKNSCDILAQEANLHRSVCVFLVDLVKGPDPCWRRGQPGQLAF